MFKWFHKSCMTDWFSRLKCWYSAQLHQAPSYALLCSIVSDSLRPPWTIAHQAPLSLGFSRQEYWSGLPCPPSGSPALQVVSLSSEPPGKPHRAFGNIIPQLGIFLLFILLLPDYHLLNVTESGLYVIFTKFNTQRLGKVLCCFTVIAHCIFVLCLAQLLPVQEIQETRVQSLGWADPLE